VKKATLRFWLLAAIGAAVVIGSVAFLPVNAGATRIHSEVDIARSPHDVFSYVTTPANWPRWHPSSIAVTGDAGHPLTLGESVTEEFRVAGHHGFVTWQVVDREDDRRWRIEGRIDGQVSGTVTYALSETGGRTHFVRDFDYPSQTVLFAILNRVFIKSRVTAESEQAVSQLREVLER
jgi:uncharacterized protein YndB with AHSA1/START domain